MTKNTIEAVIAKFTFDAVLELEANNFHHAIRLLAYPD
jgi:hypothetical protein